MTNNEYLKKLLTFKIDDKKVRIINSVYGTELPDIIQRMISGSNKTVFLDDNIRILSFDEIINAEKELHVDFKSNQIIPLVDCGENDFIVYHFFDKIWSKFDIVDETVFKKKNSLQELLI